MLYYRIRHETRFEYATPIREALGELRLRPRDERGQACLQFDLSIKPRVRSHAYRDFLGNHVHHYSVPQTHISQTVTAESLVRLDSSPAWPDALPPETWDRYDALTQSVENWDYAHPSTFAKPTDALVDLAKTLDITKHDDPLTTARHACQQVYDHFTYQPDTTHVDSPIDEAIADRGGVCQDFAHILTALLRRLGIPTRYVSGYLHTKRANPPHLAPPPTPLFDPQEEPEPENTTTDEPESSDADASHAWTEALLPTLGWVGFDPTHNEVVTTHHIRVAVGRDYADVPPTRGVYRGNATSDMQVAVHVERLEELPQSFRQPYAPLGWIPPDPPQEMPEEPQPFEYYAQQMQQQQ